jgi:hypothetical protein
MGCDWYTFTTATGYGVPVTWQDIAKAYDPVAGDKKKVKLSVLMEWLLAKTSEVEWVKIYDVVTGGKRHTVPGPYVIEEEDIEMAGLNQIQNFPGFAEDDEVLEGIAQQVTPPGVLLGYPSGWWITTSENRQSISLLTQKGQKSESDVTTKSAKTDSNDKCLFIVGADKKEIAWDRNVLADSSPTFKNILLGTGQIKPDPSKPVEWPEHHPDAVKLIFEALPFKEEMELASVHAEVVPDEVYKSCKVLSDYLGIDFYRLSIASDRFRSSERYKGPSMERYRDDRRWGM